MKLIYQLLVVVLTLFQYSHGQTEPIEPVVSENAVTEDTLSGEAAGGDGPPPQQEASANAMDASRGFLPGPRPRPPPTCPKYTSAPKNKCHGHNSYCPTTRCYRRVTKAFYYGLPFSLVHWVWVKGDMCRSEHKSCNSSPWSRCYCRTRFCWSPPLKKLIRHDGLLYLLKVYIRYPCGCSCVGKSSLPVATIAPHPWDPWGWEG